MRLPAALAVALGVGGALAPFSAVLAQPAAASAPANGGPLAEARDARRAAEGALNQAADPKTVAQATERLRQATAVEIAVATAGMSPEAAARELQTRASEARTRLAAMEGTATRFLGERLATSTTDAERAQTFRTYDSTITALRVTQEVTEEGLRRFNPVVQPTGFPGEVHREAYNATQQKLESLIDRIGKSHVEEPRLPSYRNADGTRPTDAQRQAEEHARREQRDADIAEYLRLADSGVFVDPRTGQALSQEMRDRVARDAKLTLADQLKAKGFENGAVRTLLGWTDSRGDLGREIEAGVRSNTWYRALDMLNPSVTGADPKMIATAMAHALRLSADGVYAWRAGQIPEGGNWLYENFVAKQKVGVGTAMRIDDLERGGAIDRQIEAYTREVDAAVAALNEMAKTGDPRDLSAENHKLLDAMGFIGKEGDREVYRVPTTDPGQRLQRKLNLPGATALDMISGANAMKVVVLMAAPQMLGAGGGLVAQSLELGTGAVRTAEFLTITLANAGFDAGVQKLETGTVQWDRLVLDTIVLNLGMGVASATTGIVAKSGVGLMVGRETSVIAATIARNKAARESAETIVSQTLGLYGDAALLTYWQGKFQPAGVTYDDFLANLLNGVVGRLAPSVGRGGAATARATTRVVGEAARAALVVSLRTLRDAVLGMSPALREAFNRGLTGQQLVRLLEDARFAEAEHAREASIERLTRAVGPDGLELRINDPGLVRKVSDALEAGLLTFPDLKAVLGEHESLGMIVDGVNTYRLATFDQIIPRAVEMAKADVAAEYDGRMARFRANLGEDSPVYREATEAARAWRDDELKRIDESAKIADAAPGSKNNTSDIDRSLSSAYLRNSLKVATEDHFARREIERTATSASAYDVNEYYNILKYMKFLRDQKVDTRTATHRTPDGPISHAEMMEAMGLATAMMQMPPAQRAKFQQNRMASGGARMQKLFSIANENLAKAQTELNAKVARLVTQGFDPASPDTVTRARDNLYGQRARTLAEQEATLKRLLDEKNPYAGQFAADLEARWAMTKREGIEAYTSFTGLDVIVSRAQISGLSVREMIQATPDPAQLAKLNAKRRETGKPDLTPEQRQRDIDAALADLRQSYSKSQFTAALDDQVRFMAHHINAFFEGHENATQVASALSKYAERTTLFLKLTGADVATGPNSELSRISGQLVEARSDLGRLRTVVAGYGGGDETAGIRKLIALLEQTTPGLNGLFDPAILLDASGQRVATRDPTFTRANAASLNQLLRERENRWVRGDRVLLPDDGSYSGGGIVLLSGGKADLQAELDDLMAAKVEEARLATLYSAGDWKQARDWRRSATL